MPRTKIWALGAVCAATLTAACGLTPGAQTQTQPAGGVESADLPTVLPAPSAVESRAVTLRQALGAPEPDDWATPTTRPGVPRQLTVNLGEKSGLFSSSTAEIRLDPGARTYDRVAYDVGQCWRRGQGRITPVQAAEPRTVMDARALQADIKDVKMCLAEVGYVGVILSKPPHALDGPIGEPSRSQSPAVLAGVSKLEADRGTLAPPPSLRLSTGNDFALMLPPDARAELALRQEPTDDAPAFEPAIAVELRDETPSAEPRYLIAARPTAPTPATPASPVEEAPIVTARAFPTPAVDGEAPGVPAKAQEPRRYLIAVRNRDAEPLPVDLPIQDEPIDAAPVRLAAREEDDPNAETGAIVAEARPIETAALNDAPTADTQPDAPIATAALEPEPVEAAPRVALAQASAPTGYLRPVTYADAPEPTPERIQTAQLNTPADAAPATPQEQDQPAPEPIQVAMREPEAVPADIDAGAPAIALDDEMDAGRALVAQATTVEATTVQATPVETSVEVPADAEDANPITDAPNYLAVVRRAAPVVAAVAAPVQAAVPALRGGRRPLVADTETETDAAQTAKAESENEPTAVGAVWGPVRDAAQAAASALSAAAPSFRSAEGGALPPQRAVYAYLRPTDHREPKEPAPRFAPQMAAAAPAHDDVLAGGPVDSAFPRTPIVDEPRVASTPVPAPAPIIVAQSRPSVLEKGAPPRRPAVSAAPLDPLPGVDAAPERPVDDRARRVTRDSVPARPSPFPDLPSFDELLAEAPGEPVYGRSVIFVPLKRD